MFSRLPKYHLKVFIMNVFWNQGSVLGFDVQHINSKHCTIFSHSRQATNRIKLSVFQAICLSGVIPLIIAVIFSLYLVILDFTCIFASLIKYKIPSFIIFKAFFTNFQLLVQDRPFTKNVCFWKLILLLENVNVVQIIGNCLLHFCIFQTNLVVLKKNYANWL